MTCVSVAGACVSGQGASPRKLYASDDDSSRSLDEGAELARRKFRQSSHRNYESDGEASDHKAREKKNELS